MRQKGIELNRRKPVKSLITIFVLVVIYFSGLFLHFPIAVSSSGVASKMAIEVYAIIYSPLIRNVSKDSALKVNFDIWTQYWCSKYPDRCQNESEPSA